MGKTVPEIVSTARGRLPRAVLKTEDTVSPNTDCLRLVNNIFVFSLKLHGILSKRTRMIQGCNYCKIFYKLNNY